MNKEWTEVEIRVEGFQREAVSNFLFELGAEGVQEASDELLKAYFQQAALSFQEPLERYCQNLEVLGASKISFRYRVVDSEGWSDKWKMYYRAQPLSEKFFLQPLWQEETLIPEGAHVIRMDPGMAFGTGLHESTRLCLKVMEQRLAASVATALDFLDVGTGSGILSIAANKLGVRSITAIDNDPSVLSVAEDNLKANACEGVKVSGQPLEALSAKFDLIVSNILLETHLKLFPYYAACMAQEGTLVLSGLLVEQEAVLCKHAGLHGWNIQQKLKEGEWAAYELSLRSEE